MVTIPFLLAKEMLDISIIFCIKNLFSLLVSDIMTNLAVSTITKTLTKQIIIKLMKITDRILKEVKNVNRVCYDLSPKPNATIEWE